MFIRALYLWLVFYAIYTEFYRRVPLKKKKHGVIFWTNCRSCGLLWPVTTSKLVAFPLHWN